MRAALFPPPRKLELLSLIPAAAVKLAGLIYPYSSIIPTFIRQFPVKKQHPSEFAPAPASGSLTDLRNGSILAIIRLNQRQHPYDRERPGHLPAESVLNPFPAVGVRSKSGNDDSRGTDFSRKP